MRISDWSSDVCSSDLIILNRNDSDSGVRHFIPNDPGARAVQQPRLGGSGGAFAKKDDGTAFQAQEDGQAFHNPLVARSEEHTSELQSLMRISYAVFCLKKKKTQ